MKKVALVFVLAVFVPSLVLAWLAVRSLRDQQFLLERQQSLLYQGVADALAANVQQALADYQHTFALKVAALLRDSDSRSVARSFDSQLCKEWPLAQVGFAVTLTGEILAPSPQGRPDARAFYGANSRFLANRESAEVYLGAKQVLINAGQGAAQPPASRSLPEIGLNLGTYGRSQSSTRLDTVNAPAQEPSSGQNLTALNEGNADLNQRFVNNNSKLTLRNVIPQQQAELFQNNAGFRSRQQQAPRLAAPPQTNALAQPPAQTRSDVSFQLDQQVRVPQPPSAPLPQPAGAGQAYSAPEDNQQQFSRIAPSEAEFRQLIGDDSEGTLARFVDNKLSVLFWCRPPLNSNYIFGAQLALPRLAGELQTVVQQVEPALREEICVALLDDTAKPVALSHPGFHAAWKRPFVATEIGETLPHWEVAVYLLNPAKLTPVGAHFEVDARPADRRAGAGHRRRKLADRRRPEPPAYARAPEDRLRQQRLARVEDAAHLDSHVLGAARRRPRERPRQATLLSGHHHRRDRPPHPPDQQRARLRAHGARREEIQLPEVRPGQRRARDSRHLPARTSKPTASSSPANCPARPCSSTATATRWRKSS